MKSYIYLDIKLCSPLQVNGCFRGKHCLHLQDQRISQASSTYLTRFLFLFRRTCHLHLQGLFLIWYFCICWCWTSKMTLVKTCYSLDVTDLSSDILQISWQNITFSNSANIYNTTGCFNIKLHDTAPICPPQTLVFNLYSVENILACRPVAT
jgi:hypothetical protein